MRKTAAKILKGKAFVKAELDRQVPKAQSDALWEQARARLDEILSRYRDLPRGVRMHTDSFIFPAVAIYLTAREVLGQDVAYHVIENAAVRNTQDTGKKLARLMKIPGMAGLFVRVWDPMTRKMFGADSGFRNVFYPKKKGEYRMDIIACPYVRYFTELGCPELTRIYCENDERTYGHLPGLEFIRTKTLGTGGDCCDFFVRLSGKRTG